LGVHGFGALMKHSILLTGATGMVGQALLPLLARRSDVDKIFALYRGTEDRLCSGRIMSVPGDVTAGADLGTSTEIGNSILDRVTAIIHAAADTRFSAPLHEARGVNLEGTRNVLAFARRCSRLEAILALSTVHVAGRRTGTIPEGDLTHTAGFVNSYEQSKYEAEILLREHMSNLPISVLRLSTVLGDSTTGEVGKLAAIHHALRLCYNSLAPMIPGTPNSPVDLIALDFAAAAIEHFGIDGFEAGQTFHVCGGENVLTVAELLQQTHETFLRYRPSWRKRAIEKPAIVDLPTFELFARSVEEVGDSLLRSSIALIRHFAPQLAYPKIFANAEATASLMRVGIVKPKVLDFFPKVVRWLVETAWGEQAIVAEAMASD
jgi:nucleoside-diphosphate-sugar epimerase